MRLLAKSYSGSYGIHKIHQVQLWKYVLQMFDLVSNTATGFCSCELNVTSIQGTYSWLEAIPGQSISQKCQYGMEEQSITRYCNATLEWNEDSSMWPTIVTEWFNQMNMVIKIVTVIFIQTNYWFFLLLAN